MNIHSNLQAEKYKEENHAQGAHLSLYNSSLDKIIPNLHKGIKRNVFLIPFLALKRSNKVVRRCTCMLSEGSGNDRIEILITRGNISLSSFLSLFESYKLTKQTISHGMCIKRVSGSGLWRRLDYDSISRRRFSRTLRPYPVGWVSNQLETSVRCMAKVATMGAFRLGKLLRWLGIFSKGWFICF
ncbi:Unknown protein, partial [Striga hermonthica]